MIFGKERRGEYIDLEEYGGEERVEAKMFVKVAEIQRYDDLKEYAKYVYEGNLLILDISPVSLEDMEIEKIMGEIKRIVRDIGGDVAGLDRNRIIVAPAGVKIDRRKIKKF